MQADGDVERRSEEKGGCCRSFFVDTRRYAAQRVKNGEEKERARVRRQRGLERRCVTVLYIPYRWFMQP